MSEISKAPPSVKAAITQKVNQKRAQQDESSSEMQSIKIARESTGDNHATTTRTNISTEVSTEANQDIERAEKVLDANRPAQVVENNEKEKVKKEDEETAKALNEALDQNITQTWGEVGGAKD